MRCIMPNRFMSAFGQETDMTASTCDVGFTPESGHSLRQSECLLCANKRHRSRMAAQSAGIIN